MHLKSALVAVVCFSGLAAAQTATAPAATPAGPTGTAAPAAPAATPAAGGMDWTKISKSINNMPKACIPQCRDMNNKLLQCSVDTFRTSDQNPSAAAFDQVFQCTCPSIAQANDCNSCIASQQVNAAQGVAQSWQQVVSNCQGGNFAAAKENFLKIGDTYNPPPALRAAFLGGAQLAQADANGNNVGGDVAKALGVSSADPGDSLSSDQLGGSWRSLVPPTPQSSDSGAAAGGDAQQQQDGKKSSSAFSVRTVSSGFVSLTVLAVTSLVFFL
ncbi:hypothetical protein HK102_008820 [Quaeritorhiza haematococci]|nr:hypothetical protein HK102_008820 [Quaeritorhiza haematococci]